MLDFDISKLVPVTAELGTFVILVLLGWVTFLGKMGVTGRAQLASSMASGIVVGGAFMIAVMGVPGDFAGWFGVILAGLALGLIASGVYETGKGLVTKTVERMLGLNKPSSQG